MAVSYTHLDVYKRQALKELDRAYTDKDELYLMKDDPLLKSLEKNPRYEAFLRKMNLAE